MTTILFDTSRRPITPLVRPSPQELGKDNVRMDDASVSPAVLVDKHIDLNEMQVIDDERRKLAELNIVEMELKLLDGLAYGRKVYIEAKKMFASLPIEEREVLQGDEAKRVWGLAEETASLRERETGRRSIFPPPSNPDDLGYVFLFHAEGFEYRISGDGNVTRNKYGTLTRELHELFQNELATMETSFAAADARDMKERADLNERRAALRAELGLKDGDAGPGKEVARGAFISTNA